jgi:hypothetical protein
MTLIRLAIAIVLTFITFQWMNENYPNYTGVVSVKALSNRIQNVMWGH